MKAFLNTYRQSPRKVRLLADLIRGKKVNDAKSALMFADKRAAPVFIKVLDSAIANAKNNFSLESEDLFVKEATVNAGVTLKRSMPRARGSAFPIHKRTSHIAIVLETKAPKAKGDDVKAEKKLEAPKVKAKTVKKVKKTETK